MMHKTFPVAWRLATLERTLLEGEWIYRSYCVCCESHLLRCLPLVPHYLQLHQLWTHFVLAHHQYVQGTGGSQDVCHLISPNILEIFGVVEQRVVIQVSQQRMSGYIWINNLTRRLRLYFDGELRVLGIDFDWLRGVGNDLFINLHSRRFVGPVGLVVLVGHLGSK